jgi:hypothetical protein
MMNPFRYGLFAWQLLSHKLCRWLVPFAVFLAFFSNALLIRDLAFYLYAFILQCAFYTFAIWGIWTNRCSKKYFLKIPQFWVLVNLSILNAWYRYLRGERMMSWQPSRR